MIHFSCPACGNEFNVGDDKAGKKAKCRACGAMLRVPTTVTDDDVLAMLGPATKYRPPELQLYEGNLFPPTTETGTTEPPSKVVEQPRVTLIDMAQEEERLRQQRQRDREARRLQKRIQEKFTGLAVVVLCIVGFTYLISSLGSGSSSSTGSGSGSSYTSSSDSSIGPDKITAWVMAQEFVKDRLKSPGSADFGGVFRDYQDPDRCVTAMGDGNFVVRGWVDAQNAFGAKLRANFVCRLHYAGNDNWQCEDCVVIEP